MDIVWLRVHHVNWMASNGINSTSSRGSIFLTLTMKLTEHIDYRNEVESNLTFLGFIIFENKLKPRTTSALATLRNANIRQIMCTGMSFIKKKARTLCSLRYRWQCFDCNQCFSRMQTSRRCCWNLYTKVPEWLLDRSKLKNILGKRAFRRSIPTQRFFIGKVLDYLRQVESH